MKIMTFNTQHCESFVTKKIDFQLIAGVIKKFDPDIVGLNEIRDKGERADYEAQTAILSALTNMPYYYFAKAIDVGGNNPYGNAILSKHPFTAHNIPIPDPEDKSDGNYYETRCLIKAEFDSGLTVLITHFGLNPSEHENAVKTVVNNLRNTKCVLMGDFNVEPSNPVLAPIYAKMQDTAQLMNVSKKSFPSNAPHVKIDYIFVSPDIKVISADIPNIIASDHCPHVAELL